MSRERFERVKELLLRAADLPPEERAACLDRECAGDPELRRELESLLAHEAKAPAILDPDSLRSPSRSAVPEDLDDPDATARIGREISHYRIEALLGEGGMGLVYRAEDIRLKRPVALKFLRPDAVGRGQSKVRFVHEAQAAAALDHPNICTVHAIEEHEGQVFLAMAYIDGETLRERIRRGPLPPPEALGVAAQIAAGLEAAHAKGIIHRDIKSSNVMLSREGRAQILDFGLARSAGRGEVTRSGAILGTVAYMSPEQAQGQPLDARTDLWSLGVVLYEMLTACLPFGRDQDTAILYAIVHEEPPPVDRLRPGTPRGLQDVLTRALAKDREDRYATATEFRADLERLRAAPGSFVGSTRRFRLRRRLRHRLAWLMGAVAAAAAIGTAATRVIHRDPNAAPLPQGRPHQVTSSTGRQGEPAVSPDGSRIAYETSETGNLEVAVIDAGGGNPILLTQDPASDFSPAWYPDGGRILFVSDRGGMTGIWQTGQYGGGATLVLANAYDPAVSPDGKRIAFARPDSSGTFRIGVASLADSSDLVMLTREGDGLWGHRHPAWSPDGRRICYESFDELWLVPSRGGSAGPLISGHRFDLEPVWSHDGRFVYFSSYREGTRALWRVSARGGTPRRLTIGTGPEVHPSLSRDGSRLAYSTQRGTRLTIVLDRRTGAEVRLAVPSQAIFPTLAPDGSRLVFASLRTGEYRDLYMQPLENGRPSGTPLRLNNHPGNSTFPTFSPDGRWIAYCCVLGAQRDIWILPAQGGKPYRITEDPAADYPSTWSPDGRNLAFASDRGGTPGIWVVPIENGRATGPAVPVPTSGVGAMGPAWSPDGRWIAFVATRVEEDGVWIVPADGSSPPRRLMAGRNPRHLRWDGASGRLLVSATGDDEKTVLFSLAISDGEPMLFEPRVEFGSREAMGVFDVSSDARWLVHTLDEPEEGDIWVLAATAGTF